MNPTCSFDVGESGLASFQPAKKFFADAAPVASPPNHKEGLL